jgi:hypothetical protein
MTNCVNGVCAFLNSVGSGSLETASADVAWNGGSIARANGQILEATGVRMGQMQAGTLETARARQFFVVYPGTSAQTADHVLIGINNGGRTMLYDPQIGAKIFDVGSYGPFVAFPVAFWGEEMDSLESLVLRFVRLHYHLEPGDLDARLTEDFFFDDGLENIPRDEYLSVQRGYGALEGFTLLDTIVAGNRAAIMFEGTDSVTGLFHRFCWLLTIDGQRISRVSTCSGRLLSPQDRPKWSHKA